MKRIRCFIRLVDNGFGCTIEAHIHMNKKQGKESTGMKQLAFILIALLVLTVIGFAQKQVLPVMPGGTQGTRAAMLKGPHDFTPDSGAVNTFGTDSLGN